VETLVGPGGVQEKRQKIGWRKRGQRVPEYRAMNECDRSRGYTNIHNLLFRQRPVAQVRDTQISLVKVAADHGDLTELSVYLFINISSLGSARLLSGQSVLLGSKELAKNA